MLYMIHSNAVGMESVNLYLWVALGVVAAAAAAVRICICIQFQEKLEAAAFLSKRELL